MACNGCGKAPIVSDRRRRASRTEPSRPRVIRATVFSATEEAKLRQAYPPELYSLSRKPDGPRTVTLTFTRLGS